MRKILIIFSLLFILTACSKSPVKEPVQDKAVESKDTENKDTESKDASDTSTEQTEQSKKEENEGTGKIEVDKKLLTTEIHIPASIFGDDPITQEEIDESVAAGTFKEGKVNPDGSVTYVVTKEQHKKLMDNFMVQLKSTLDSLVDDENNSFLKIEVNSDTSEYKVYVDPERYNEFESFSALGLYLQSAFYRSIAGDKDIYTTVKFINNETGETLNEANSKEFFEQKLD